MNAATMTLPHLFSPNDEEQNNFVILYRKQNPITREDFEGITQLVQEHFEPEQERYLHGVLFAKKEVNTPRIGRGVNEYHARNNTAEINIRTRDLLPNMLFIRAQGLGEQQETLYQVLVQNQEKYHITSTKQETQ